MDLEDPKIRRTLEMALYARSNVWREFKQNGASNSEIRSFLSGQLFHGDPGGGGPGYYSYSTDGTKCALWIGDDAFTGRYGKKKSPPDLKGDDLIQIVRRVIGIPLPGGITQLKLF
jgi:hypothetical protein